MSARVTSISLPDYLTMYCPLCGRVASGPSLSDPCAHVLYAGTDEGFDYVSARYLIALGLPPDTEAVDVQSAYAELLADSDEDSDEDDFDEEEQGVGEITETSRIHLEFQITLFSPGISGFVGFAPTGDEV